MIAGCPDNSGSNGATATTGSVSGSGTSSGSGGSGRGGFSGTPGGSDQPGSNGAASFITISRVVRSNKDSNTLLDLITTNGDIGTNCTDINACRCVFNWLDASGIARNAEASLTYVEANLARCPFTIVSSDARYFDVSLKIVAGNLSSNATRIFMPTSNPSLDSTLASNYLPVQRYMCRDILDKNVNTVKYQGITDPALWDYSLPYTFYTTSLGLDYGATAVTRNGSVQNMSGYECPPIPNDPSDNSIYDYNLYSLGDIDLRQPARSDVPIGTGDHKIWPVDDDIGTNPNCPTGNEAGCKRYLINRHDFYLATFKSSIFKQPVCIMHKVANRKYASQGLDCTGVTDTATSGPITLTSPSVVGKDIVGFAAVPDQNQNCPDPNSVKLPSGKKWAKVWQFRTSYSQRTIEDIANPSDIGALYCTTRENECQTNFPGPFSDGSPVGVVTSTSTLKGTSAAAGGGYKPTYPAGVRTHQIVDTVCYNAKVGLAGPTNLSWMGFTQSAQIGSSSTDPGFGNCDINGSWGDGNGDRTGLGPSGTIPASLIGNTIDPAGTHYYSFGTDGQHSRVGNDINGVTGALVSTSSVEDNDPTKSYAPGRCRGTSPSNYNCCFDSGHPPLGPNRPMAGYDSTANPMGAAGADTSSSFPFYAPANFTPGGQVCTPTLIGRHNASSKSIWGHQAGGTNGIQGVGQDVWLMGGGNLKACIEADTDENGKLFDDSYPSQANPFQMHPKVIDSDAQFDIVYVVTPERIKIEDMADPNGAIAKQYTPWRWTPHTSNTQKQIYQLRLGQGNSNSSNPTDRLSVFPLCVVQDTMKGQRLGDPQ